MESRSHALLAGVFLILMTAAVVAVVFWFTGDRSEQVRYVIVSTLPVSGLMVDAPVRLRGVDVGSVESIHFDAKAPRNILVNITVDRAAPMTQGVYAQLEFWGISGLKYVALSDDGATAQHLSPGARIAMRPSFIGQAATSVESLLSSADEAVQRLAVLLSEENVARTGRTLEKIERAVDELRVSVTSLQSDVSRRTLPKVDLLLDLLVNDARKLDQLLTSLNEQPQSLILGRPPTRPGPGEPGFEEKKDGR